MTIQEILKLDTNKDVRGTFTVKTAKKIWEDSEGYIHQVLLSDSTGDMLADCFVGSFTKIQRGSQIDLIEAMTQHGENGIRLYVQMWEYAGEPVSEPPDHRILSNYNGDRAVQGKIKTHLVAAFIMKYGTAKNENGKDADDFADSDFCNSIVSKLMK